MTTKQETKKDAVLRIFNELPAGPMADDIAVKCMQEGVWTEEQKYKMVFRNCKAEVRKILSDAGEDGLPSALHIEAHPVGEDGVGAPLHFYFQREFWTRNRTKKHIRLRIKQLKGDWDRVRPVIEWAEEQWPEDNWWVDVPEDGPRNW